MKKVVIIAVIAFLVSLAAGAMGRKALTPPPTEEEIAAAAGHDAEGEPSSESGTDSAHGDEGAHGAADSLGQGHGDEPGGEHGTGDTEDHVLPDPRSGNFEFREMGHILSNMEPREAGLFLSYLDDDRAMGLLRAMNVGNAAAALAYVPEKRKERLKARLMTLILEEE